MLNARLSDEITAVVIWAMPMAMASPLVVIMMISEPTCNGEAGTIYH